MSAPLSDLEAELKECEAKIGAAYWAFTRQAQAKPPVMVVPEAYRRRSEILAQLAALGVDSHAR